MKLGIFHFQVLYNVLENIHFIYDENELAETVLSTVSQALNAEAGSIFTLLEDGSIFPLASYGAPVEKLREKKFEMGQGVVGWVAQYTQPLKIDKPQQDSRFTGNVDVHTGFKTRSIIAAPIMSKGKCIGIIEFLNRKDGSFAVPDLELVSMVGREVGIAFENARLIQGLEKSRAFREAIVSSLSAGVLVTDQEDHIVEMNPAAQKILGTKIAAGDGKTVSFEHAFDSLPELMQVMKEVATSADPILRQELRVTVKQKPMVVGYSGVPSKDRAKKRLGSVLLFQDITSIVGS